jgi:hypothetical protein
MNGGDERSSNDPEVSPMLEASSLLRNVFSVVVLVLCCFSVSPAWAQDEVLDDREIGLEAPKSTPRDAARAAKIRTIEQRLLGVQQVVRGLQNELRALKAQESPGIAEAESSTPRGPGAPPTPAPRTQVTQAPRRAPTPSPGTSEEERAVSPDQEVPEFTPGALRETRAVLIRPGLLEIDPRLRYEFSRRDVLDVSGVNIVEAIFVGRFRIGEVTRDRISPNVSFRYGITRDLQFNMAVPYAWVKRETILPATVQTELSDLTSNTSSDWGLGDVSLGFSYHVWKESELLPDLILTTNLKTKTGDGPFDVALNESSTGTGFWGGSLGLTAVKVSDPGVLFANLGYFYHHKDDVRGFTFDPPDSVDWGLGYSWALNPYLNLTTRIEGRFVVETEINGTQIEGSGLTIANLGLGLAYGYSSTGSLDVFVQFGLTDDAPDFSMVVSRPFIFNGVELFDKIF